MQKSELPKSLNGYTEIMPWRESESGRSQVIPELRRRLVDLDYDPMFVQRMDDGEDTYITLHFCDDLELYFDEDEALDDYDGLITNVVKQAKGIRDFREDLILSIDDCSSYSIRKIYFGLLGDNIEQWEREQISIRELIKNAYVSLD